jgi:hypothetical protein
MTDMACCPLGADDGDLPSVCDVRTRRAAKDHACSECGEAIPRGTQYEHVKGLWDGSWSTFRTCLSCVEIRAHFACEGRWVYGELWSQLEDNFFPDMKAGGPCMEGLSPAAKNRLFERRMKWLED